MIKNVICGILATAAIAIGTIGAFHYEANYTRENCVVIGHNGYWTMVEDKQGHVWGFEGDFFKVGDKVDVKMNTNGTKSINDDYVTKVTYAK